MQLGYERSRASELIHLLRLLLLVVSVWLNNGTLPSPLPQRHSHHSLKSHVVGLLALVFYVAYRIYVEDMYNTVTNSLIRQVCGPFALCLIESVKLISSPLSDTHHTSQC